jgi:hypothetical protein
MLISQNIDLCRWREIGKGVLLVLVAFNMREYSSIEGKLGTKGANALCNVMVQAEVGKRRCLVSEIPFEILEYGIVISIYRKSRSMSNPWVCARELRYKM